jgi:hypothetical protein
LSTPDSIISKAIQFRIVHRPRLNEEITVVRPEVRNEAFTTFYPTDLVLEEGQNPQSMDNRKNEGAGVL